MKPKERGCFFLEHARASGVFTLGFSRDKGQMAVELAILMPLVVVMAFVAINLMVYLGDCARFDRVSPEIVRLHVSSPAASEYASSDVLPAIKQDIMAAMGDASYLSFDVTCDGGALLEEEQSVGTDLSFVPQPQKYTCVLHYLPWPLDKGVFGFEPTPLEHTRTYVFDPYRPGVFV